MSKSATTDDRWQLYACISLAEANLNTFTMVPTAASCNAVGNIRCRAAEEYLDGHRLAFRKIQTPVMASATPAESIIGACIKILCDGDH